MPTAITPVEVTPSTGSWLDVDVSAYLGADAGDVAGVIVLMVNTSSTTRYNCGNRKNGSGDTRISALSAESRATIYVGVDGDDIFEVNLANAALEVWLVGYFINAEAKFLTNETDMSITATGAWTDIDISGETDTDTPLAAFFEVAMATSSTIPYGIQNNGSSDFRTRHLNGWNATGVAIGIDGSELCEMWISSTAVDLYFRGYAIANVTMFVNGVDYQENTTIGSYVDVDFSTDIPAGNDGAFCNFHTGDFTNYLCALRENGETDDLYYNTNQQTFPWSPVDGDRVAEQKIEDAALNLYLLGYSNTAVSGPEILKPDGDDAGWDSGGWADVDDTLGDSGQDSDFVAETTKGTTMLFDLTPSAVVDADTVNTITIKLRARTGGSGTDILGVELLIGGVSQGLTDTAALTGSFAQYDVTNAGWDADWTAAQMDGAQVRVTADQTGMPAATGHEVSVINVEVDFTEAGGGPTPVSADVTAGASVAVTKKISKLSAITAGATAVSSLIQFAVIAASVTAGATVAAVKKIAKSATVTAGASVAVTKKISKFSAITAGATAVSSLIQFAVIAASVTAGATVAVSKKISKSADVTATASVAALKKIGKSATVTAGATAVASLLRVTQVSASAAAGATVVVTKKIIKAVAINAGPTLAVSKKIAKSAAVTAGASVAVVRKISKSASVTATASVAVIVKQVIQVAAALTAGATVAASNIFIAGPGPGAGLVEFVRGVARGVARGIIRTVFRGRRQ